MRWALAGIVLAPGMVFAQACVPPPGSAQLESQRFAVGLRTAPARVEVGKHFSLELTVCPKPGVSSPESVQVDAHMPEHRHGMNYAAKVVAEPGGQYRAEGLLFHMPGRWEVVVDVRSQGKTDRLARSWVVE